MIKELQNSNYKDTIREALLLTSFAGLLFTNQISNYTLNSYLIKAAALVFAAFIQMYYRADNQFVDIIKAINRRNAFIILGILVIYPVITILYSVNPVQGLLKTANMIISVIPLIILLYFLLKTNSRLRKAILISGAMITGIVFSLIVILFYPFNHYDAYVFEPGRLSHVMVGRILGLSFLIVLFALKSQHIIYKILLGLILVLVGYAGYLTALRASVLGLGLSILIYIIFNFRVRENRRTLGVVIGMVIAILLTILLTTEYVSPMPKERFGSFEKLNTGNEDGAVKARYYLYNRAIDMIKENPVLGVGYGGFAEKEGNFVVYPHNLVLEVYSEMGIIGGTLILGLIIISLIKAYKINRNLFIFLVYAFVLAMFSKDLTTNGMLVMGVGVILRKQRSMNGN